MPVHARMMPQCNLSELLGVRGHHQRGHASEAELNEVADDRTENAISCGRRGELWVETNDSDGREREGANGLAGWKRTIGSGVKVSKLSSPERACIII